MTTPEIQAPPAFTVLLGINMQVLRTVLDRASNTIDRWSPIMRLKEWKRTAIHLIRFRAVEITLLQLSLAGTCNKTSLYYSASQV